MRNSLFGLAFFLSFAFFYVTVFIPQALAPVTGWLAICGWMIFWLFNRVIPHPANLPNDTREALFFSWKNLSTRQKWIAAAIAVIGLAYFCLFIPVNLKGAETPHDFFLSGGDEYVMYPVVVKMLALKENLRFNLYHFFVYGDYIYGFPFYGLSALLLLPSRLIFGQDFAGHTQINLLILRQLVTVLPAVLSAFGFTYLSTRFKRWLPSLGVFLIFLSIPGVVYNNTRFWHPDSLNLFFIMMTFYFLDRDRLRFGKNFYVAAIFCGLSAATRLFGLFFFLAVAGLLIIGVVKKTLSIKKGLISGLLFILVMFGSIFISSPYLFHPGEYASLQRLAERKQVDMAQGYAEPDPEGVYRTGFSAWWPHMKKWYGNGFTLGFLALAMLAGMLSKERRLFYWILFAWTAVTGVYLIFFVVVKSFQYMLPFLVPLYASALALPEWISGWSVERMNRKWLKKPCMAFAYAFPAVILIIQFVQNIQWILTHAIFA